MEEFPATFRSETFLKVIDEQNTVYKKSQTALLAKVRQSIVTTVTLAVERGDKEILICLPDDLCNEMSRKLSQELLDRFPDQLWYHRIINYADVDEFTKLTKPRACFEIKIIF